MSYLTFEVLDGLSSRVAEDGIAQLCFELVEQWSPTGDTAAVAALLAQRLDDRGMTVRIESEQYSATPSVVARLSGDRPGPTVIFNGHLDTVPIPHARACLDPLGVSGRGAADMKGGLACAAEVVRLLAEEAVGFPGEVWVVATGLHEAPGGRSEDLISLLKAGLSADAVIVCEAGSDALPIAQMGAAIFEVRLQKTGPSVHELAGRVDPESHPIHVAGRVVAAIEEENRRLGNLRTPLVGPESFFIGECVGGDFYNRVPKECRLSGTRRWLPGRSVADVGVELQELIAPFRQPDALDIEATLTEVRPSYDLSPDDLIVTALREGYQEVTGSSLALTGSRLVADGSIFAQFGIPAVYHGPAGEGAHGDHESVTTSELGRATRVYLHTLSRYWQNWCNTAESPQSKVNTNSHWRESDGAA